MFDEYFQELDPIKRKAILDAIEPEAGEEEALAAARALFSLRYKQNKRKETYADLFIRAFVDLRVVAFNEDDNILDKRTFAKQVRNAAHVLCLDRADEFPREVLAGEMHQLVSLFVHSSLHDHHYGAILFGMGRLDDEVLAAKVKSDLTGIRDGILHYVGSDAAYDILQEALTDRLNEGIEC